MMNWLVISSLIACALVGQVGLVVALHNRINAMGGSRLAIKLAEKLAYAMGVLLPCALLLCEWYYGTKQWPIEFSQFLIGTKIYLLSLLGFVFVVGPAWIASRPCFVVAHDRYSLTVSHLWKNDVSLPSPFQGALIRLFAKLPRNEVGWMEANHKLLKVDNLPRDLIGLKIGHISDIHLMQQMTNDYYHRAFRWLNEQEVDLLVVSGDIVDFDRAIKDLVPVFQPLHAAYGKYFLLGNHDQRVTNPDSICQTLRELGWQDAGSQNQQLSIGETRIEIVGNERPWFLRNEMVDSSSIDQLWRLGIAHSPDQFLWGQKLGCRLLLCGHTHGGQIRFPWIGPIVSPSWYGSRFASGLFFQGGTLMHVSRGMSGTHPLRWGCPPEVSVLTLMDARVLD